MHPCTHRPVHTGHRAPGKEASYAAGHVDLVAQNVFPPAIAELEQLVCVCGHPWREEEREAGGPGPRYVSEYLPQGLGPLVDGPSAQGEHSCSTHSGREDSFV